MAIKEQALVDFLVEKIDESVDPKNSFNSNLPEDPPQLWNIFVDGASRKGQREARVLILSPKGVEMPYE